MDRLSLYRIISISIMILAMVAVPSQAQQTPFPGEAELQVPQVVQQKPDVEPMTSDEAVAPSAVPSGVPSDVDSVRVECFGDCSDNSLGELCGLTGAPAGGTATPIAVACVDIEDSTVPDSTLCGGVSSDNRCDMTPSLFGGFNETTRLDELCEDVIGWDAIVYCAK
jgi:hypothetical protein